MGTPATLDHNGAKYGLPGADVSDASDEADRRAENEFHAMQAVHEALPQMRRALFPMKPQEVFLRVLTAVVSAQYGHRDPVAEDKTGARFIHHFGLKAIIGDERS